VLDGPWCHILWKKETLAGPSGTVVAHLHFFELHLGDRPQSSYQLGPNLIRSERERERRPIKLLPKGQNEVSCHDYGYSPSPHGLHESVGCRGTAGRDQAESCVHKALVVVFFVCWLEPPAKGEVLRVLVVAVQAGTAHRHDHPVGLVVEGQDAVPFLHRALAKVDAPLETSVRVCLFNDFEKAL